jgi:hypothetical protein
LRVPRVNPRRNPRHLNALLVSALLVCSAAVADAASVFDPTLRFRALPTEHFFIYFHQGEDRMARRMAAIAEDTWRKLERPLGVRPPPLTHVVLADQSEFANGYATPVPYNTIVIYTAWPSGSEFDFDDWLRLAFVHEFTHIVHLDRSEGWARIARNIVGRAPYAFPNIFLPLWQIEGIATYEESVVTGQGRLHAGDYRAIVGEAARARRLEPLDRVNGGLTDWPAGATQYAYGVGFHEYLANRFGADKIAELATATARRFPYTSTKAFEYVYGESLGDLWRAYEASLISAARAAPADAQLRRLTHQGFTVAGPRFDRFVCASCSPEIIYSARNPDGFPGLYRIALDGSPPIRMTDRYLGATLGLSANEIVFDQAERRRNVGLYSDLYVLSRSDGSIRQLSSEARLVDPDLSPDGTTIVCTQGQPGQRNLVMVRLKADATYGQDDAAFQQYVASGFSRTVAFQQYVASGFSRTVASQQHVASGFSRTVASQQYVASGFSRTVIPLIAEPDVYFDAPRWSPDGRTVAVERHRVGAMPEIVIVDVATKSVRVVASDPRTRFTMPTWRPDGAALIVAAAPEEQTFNLVEVMLDGSTMRQLTHTSGGAIWPDVSADGKTIVFAGYTVDGYDLFSLPYPIETGDARRATLSGSPPSNVDLERVDQQLRAIGYNPLKTLAPTSWTPVIDNDGETVRFGGSVSGIDVLGYHGYSATASWLVTSTTTATRPPHAVPDWELYYQYDRWQPAFYTLASEKTSFSAGPPTSAGTASDSTLRSTTLEAGVLFPILHARTLHSAFASIARSRSEFTLPDGALTRDRTPLRAAWQTITARNYGYSISPEDGIAAGATVEAVRKSLWSDADATTITADVRAYLPGVMPHHIVALRLSGGVSNGDPTVGRTFLLGGSTPANSLVDFSSRSSSLLRGFADATFAGSRVALVNAEYRFPVFRLERGIGTWPIFFHTIHGSVFGDAGETWTTRFGTNALKTSAGVEASCDLVVAYVARLTIALGAALGHDRSGTERDGAVGYFRIGKAF